VKLPRRSGLAALVVLWGATATAQTASNAVEVRAFDDTGTRVDLTRTHASLSRTLPPELGELPGPDHDALRFLLIGPPRARHRAGRSRFSPTRPIPAEGPGTRTT